MRAVIQRVKEASASVDGKITGSITHGVLVYLGVGKGDCEEELDFIINKILKLRIFEDEDGRMNRSVLDVDGDILLISQFTLYGCVKKGTRPSFNDAANPRDAEALYDKAKLKLSNQLNKASQAGIFGANMHVSSVNDGPVTILLSKRKLT